MVENFVIQQLRLDTTNAVSAETFLGNIEQIDALLADNVAGLAPALDNFYKGLEAGAAAPSSVPARQVALAATENKD
jgi:flagellar hook-associated protein 1 FlgK